MNFADALRQLEPAAEVTALGTVRGLDTMLIPARGYPLELIPPAPLSACPPRTSRCRCAAVSGALVFTGQVARRAVALWR